MRLFWLLSDFQTLWNMRKVHEDLSHIVYTYVTNVTRGLPGLKPRHDPHSEVFPSQHWQPPFLQKAVKNDEKIEKRDFVSLNNVEHQNKSFLSHFLTIIVDGGVVSRSLLFHPLYFLGFPFFLRHIPQSVLSISRAVKGSTDMWSNLELIFPIYRTLPDYR